MEKLREVKLMLYGFVMIIVLIVIVGLAGSMSHRVNDKLSNSQDGYNEVFNRLKMEE